MNKILLLMLLVLATVLGTCSKDNDDDIRRGANGERLVSKIIEHDNKYGDDIYTFYYDKQGRIEKIINTGNDLEEGESYVYTTTYTFTGSQLISKCVNGDDIYTVTYTLNSKGFVTKATDKEEYRNENDQQQESTNYTYDENDQLIQTVQNGGYTTLYTWSNGNLIQEARPGETNIYSYIGDENKSNFDFGAFYFGCESYDLVEMLGYKGKCSKNLLKHDGRMRRSYNYTFDDEGVVTQIKEHYDNDDTHLCIYTIEYK